MKHIILILVLTFSLPAQAEDVPVLNGLDSLAWKNRIIVIKDPNNTDESLQLLKTQTAEINDRDIIWFIFKDELALTNYPGKLSNEFVRKTREKLDPVPGKVILIGKDGGIKSESDALDLGAIFTQIDGMPMRQYEMLN